MVEPSDIGGVIVIQHGRQGGQQQIQREVIKAGKNAGRANETSPYEQALAEARSKWTRQRDRKLYGLTVEESRFKRAAAPMLAYNYADHVKKVDWRRASAQRKYDGLRCITTRTQEGLHFLSREGESFVLPHLTDAMAKMPLGLRIDGELYHHGTPLRTIMSWARRTQSDTEKLNYMLYDVFDGADYDERLIYLERLVGKFSEQVQLAETFDVKDEELLMKLQGEFINEGYEGAMLRHGSRGYEAGKRSQGLLKVKTFQDDEFEIVSVKEGRSTYAGTAILICDTRRGATFDVTAPGDMAEKKKAWKSRESLPGKWVTVKFAGWTTTADPKPFHPVAKLIHPGLRPPRS